MRTYWQVLSLTVLFLPVSTNAQRDLSGSPQHSRYTYIYRIDDREALKLYRTEMEGPVEPFLHTLVDSVPASGKEAKHLAPGNYLWVRAQENKLHAELRTEGALRYDILNDGRGLVLSLRTKNGNPVTDARVRIGRREVPYDTAIRSYRLPRRHKRGNVQVDHKGVLSYFSVDRGGYYQYRRGVWSRLSNSWPLKWVLRPIRTWAYLRRSRHDEYAFERKYVSFLVFSKPKYKPGDTVKGKAFIEDWKGHPVRQPLSLRISEYYSDVDTVLGLIKPYRPGGFEFSFVLTDSLKLPLDEEYQAALEEPERRPMVSDDEETPMRRRMAKGSFRLEEYELSSVRLLARMDREQNSPGNPMTLYMRGADENDMTLPDARVSIYVTAPRQITHWGAPNVFLPDTLWQTEQVLDPVGETKVLVPDSIFPKASFSYTIDCRMLNSSNEVSTETFYPGYALDTARIVWRTYADSLYMDHRVYNKSVPVRGLLYRFDREGDTLGVYHVSLPGAVRIDPYSKRYAVTTLPDSTWDEFEPATDKQEDGTQPGDEFICTAARTRDSIRVKVYNPRRLPFWYTIYYGNKVLQKGYGDSLFYHVPARNPKNYFVSLKYLWGGQQVNKEYTVPYRDKVLHMDIQKPSLMYPGQEATITVGVKDVEGRPVEGADVTAYAFTRKFPDVRPPRVPYLGKWYPGRKRSTNFQPGTAPQTTYSGWLDWQLWRGAMRLDTSEYYKFLHPSPIYINREPSPDGETQIAPFISDRLGTYPADILYIDELPVFFDQANFIRRYSFHAYPGVHTLRMRIAGRQVKLDSIRLEKGMKTFVSINADQPGGHVQVDKMPDSLTWTEQASFRNYMILLENNFRDDFVTLTQERRSYLPDVTGSERGFFLAGPFYQQPAVLSVKGGFQQGFIPEGNYRFHIENQLIREKEVPAGLLFDPHLGHVNATINLHDQALTQHEVDSLWAEFQDRRSADQNLFDNDLPSGGYVGRLEIDIPDRKKMPGAYIRKIFLFRCDNPSVMGVYKGATRVLGSLDQGYYRLLLLLKGDRYQVADSIQVRAGGHNYYSLGHLPVHEQDSFSIRVSNTVRALERPKVIVSGGKELEDVLKSANDRWANINLRDQVSGTVTDDKGQPVAGATVAIKGLRGATATDGRGWFRLDVPVKGTLTITSVGYVAQQLPIRPGNEYNIRLKQSENRLEEVVVTAYGLRAKKELTGSVSYADADNMLMGRVPGVNISEDSDKYADSIRKAVAAAEEFPTPSPLSLRRNFRDEAFWQPRLVTDQQGQASFKTRLPDDITNWNVYAIAMTDRKQTGFMEDSIRAFKALSARLAVPNFIIGSDSLEIIGKIMNYLPDSVSVERSLQVDGQPMVKDVLSLRNAHIDHIPLRTAEKSTDSMIVEYSFVKKDGYSDGERRAIPVYPVGVKETAGSFLPLDNADTNLTLSFLPDRGPVTVYAESSLLPILLDEIDHIRHYEYLCNEQLASKLLALLEERKIDSILQKPFTGNKDIYDIIGRLLKARRPDGFWGWWTGDEPRMWISLHVTQALLTAEKAGYSKVQDKQRIIDYLIYTLEGRQTPERIARIKLLQAMEVKTDYRSLIDTTEKELKQTAAILKISLSLSDRLELLSLRQAAGLPIDVSPILAQQRATAFGNRYWGEDRRDLFDNAVLNTVLVYRLLKRAGGYDNLLRKVRGYFLEKRKDGHWQNTYESSLVLETILPDVLNEDPVHHPARLTLGGLAPVTSFPYKGEWPATTPMTVHKTGSLPVYLAAWQQYWNDRPAAVSGLFSVKSYFEKNGKKLELLRAGEPVLLKADVLVKADADYVMIEIPIPAGCSYEGKMQEYGSEIHREYFKNKVSIFCASLRPGNYTYTVQLMPRWTGVYHLNPAKAEMMYFPVFFGREELKEVRIGEGGLQSR